MQNKLKYKFPAPIYARISWNIKKVFLIHIFLHNAMETFPLSISNYICILCRFSRNKTNLTKDFSVVCEISLAFTWYISIPWLEHFSPCIFCNIAHTWFSMQFLVDKNLIAASRVRTCAGRPHWISSPTP